jgi:hypothetical protein
MAQQPFPKDSRLTSIVLAYRNAEMIADNVLPLTTVPTPEFRWTKYDLNAPFRIPETLVGRKSRTNAVETNATEDVSSTEDHGLEYPVPQRDIDRQTDTFRPVEIATEWLAQLMALSREKRVADMVFQAALYPTANKETLSGTAQFSDFTNSDPLAKLLTIMDGLIMRPNKIIMGNAVWSVLRRHPKLVRAFHGNEGGEGIITRQYLAELLEVQEIQVGQGWCNLANVGQTPNIQRIWGKHILLIYSDKLAGPQTGLTFGMTAQFGQPLAGRVADPHMGLRGGTIVRTGWEIKELVTAPWLGYFIQNAVA